MTKNVGEHNGRAKLTWKKVLKIRRLYDKNDYTQNELAERFGVSRPNICYIVNDRTWRNRGET